ncbi:MAG: DUF6338 family protein [Vogesella sp.]|uniref:DUF6338 family protein n=1 Tax=Vogesella sp. TaxID=1904252 RepID=UPI00391BF8AE
MSEIKEILPFFQYLINGFVAAWIFHGLTSYKIDSPFERIVHALILTSVVSFFVFCLKSVFFWIGDEVYSFGLWNNSANSSFNFLIAVFSGLFLSYSANNDLMHTFLRRINITRETSFPSEWYGSFADQDVEAYVILHLDDGRRVMGYPREWPSQAKSGHFVLNDISWLGDGEQMVLSQVDKFLVPVEKVVYVEFLKYEV